MNNELKEDLTAVCIKHSVETQEDRVCEWVDEILKNKPAPNPLALPEINMYELENIYELAAIVTCRKILDKLRGDWMPNFNNSGISKYYCVYSHESFNFIVGGAHLHQVLPKFWYLESKNACNEFLDLVDHRTLYLALYGEQLKD